MGAVQETLILVGLTGSTFKPVGGSAAVESRNNTYVTINITISTVDYTLAKTYFSFAK